MGERREPKGAVEYSGGNAKYLQVSYGCLCEVSKKFIEGWVNPIHQLSGETIPDKWIKVYKELEVWVNKLEWYEHKYGDNDYMGWKMHAEAGGINYILDLALNGSATQKFMFSARNINFNVPLEIAAWTNNSDGKLAVWLKQDGQTIFQYYKKGDMKNCPEPVQRSGIGGKVTWDWAETEKFLWNEMQTVITPAVAEAARLRDSENQRAYPTYSEPEYSGQPTYGSLSEDQAYEERAEANNVATNLGDMVTAKQLGMIRAVAREANVDGEAESQALLRCGVAELSKRGASDLIEHLQALQRQGAGSNLTPALQAPPIAVQPVTSVVAQPDATPASQTITQLKHPIGCSCAACYDDIPF